MHHHLIQPCYAAKRVQARCQSLAYGHTMLLTLQISCPRNFSCYVAAVYTPSCTFMPMIMQLLFADLFRLRGSWASSRVPGGGLPGSFSSLRNAAMTCWPEGPLTTPMRTLLRSRLGSSAALGAADSDCVRLPVCVLRRRCVFSPCQTRARHQHTQHRSHVWLTPSSSHVHATCADMRCQ